MNTAVVLYKGLRRGFYDSDKSLKSIRMEIDVVFENYAFAQKINAAMAQHPLISKNTDISTIYSYTDTPFRGEIHAHTSEIQYIREILEAFGVQIEYGLHEEDRNQFSGYDFSYNGQHYIVYSYVAYSREYITHVTFQSDDGKFLEIPARQVFE